MFSNTAATQATSLISTQETEWDAFNLAWQLPRLQAALSTTTIC